MEMLQLKCAIAVMEHKNFTKAANSLYISQPYLSQLIKRLEDELGTPLFYRSRQGLVPTEFCTEFCRCAGDVINAWDALELKCSRRADSVKIGILKHLQVLKLPKVINSFHLENPDIHIHAETFSEKDLPGILADTSMDAIFLRASLVKHLYGNTAFKIESFYHEPIDVLMSPSNPLAGYASLDKSMISGQRIVAPLKGTHTHSAIVKHFNVSDEDSDLLPVTTDDYDLVAELILNSDALSLGSRSVGTYYGLKCVPFVPVIYNDACIVIPSGRKMSRSLARLKDYINDCYSNNQIPGTLPGA